MALHRILLDGSPIDFTVDDLPMFVEGPPGSGASHFAVTVAARLAQAGVPLLFYTAFPRAREALKEDLGTIPPTVTLVESGDENAFLEALASFHGVVFVKNSEVLASERLVGAVTGRPLLVSGAGRIAFAETTFNTEVRFTADGGYEAQLTGRRQGAVRLVSENAPA